MSERDLTDVINESLESAGLTGQDSDHEGVLADEAPSEPAAAAPEGDAAPAPDADAPVAPAGDPAPSADTAAPVAQAAPVAPAKRQGPIPFARHEKILANEREKHETEKAALTKRLESVAWAEHPEAQARQAAMNASLTHPELFATAILRDARLGPIFRKMLQGDAPAAPPAADTSALGPRPGPNTKDAEGNLGYDEAGLNALLDWTARSAAAAAETKLTKAFEEKFGKIDPLLKEHEQAQAWRQEQSRASRDIEHARRNWFGFQENEPLIKAAIMEATKQKRYLSLEQAYQDVVVKGKFTTDRAKIRDEVFAEMKGKAGAAVPRPAAAAAGDTSGKRDMVDIINESIAHLQG